MRNSGSIGGRRGLVFFCFLVYIVAFFFMSPINAYASEVNDLGITTESEPRRPTVINEPGSAEDAADLRDLFLVKAMWQSMLKKIFLKSVSM